MVINSIEVRNIIRKTEEYMQIPSVIGYEKPFIDYLEKDFTALGCKIERREKILHVYKDKSTPLFLSAHIDRHGIIYNGNAEFHYAAHYVKLNNYEAEFSNPKLSLLQKVSFRFNNQRVYAYNPENGFKLGQGTIYMPDYTTIGDTLIFTIEKLKNLPEGTPVSFVYDDRQEEDEIFSAQLDNAISVAAIYQLFRYGFTGNAFFTTEEEIGQSWKHLRNYLVEQNIESRNIYVLDVSPYPTNAEANEGVVILRNKDENGVFNKELVQKVKELCVTHAIPYEFKDEFIESQNAILAAEGKELLKMGRTELGWLVKQSNGAWNGITIQLPTYNYHSSQETTTALAIENWFRLLRLLFEVQP
jgi:putative aminopeptidase FrvX